MLISARSNPLDSLRAIALQAGMTRDTPHGKLAKKSSPGDVHKPGSQPGFFLRTKVLPPRPAPELLNRPRLTERLLANLSQPVTLVTANAGSGKTTLIADFLRTQDRQFVWYQLDHTDADPAVFLGYITFGMAQVISGFGSAMFSFLKESAGELAQHPERAVDVLLNEVLEHVDQQLILVLDDYHHLGERSPINSVLDRLLAYLPDVLHVIIISRDMPPLARLRAQSQLSVFDRNDLLFTDDETQTLFRRVFDLELSPEQLAEYRERTHGWITALQLVKQVAQRSTGNGHDTPDLVEVLRQSERDIFDYFAEEVFLDESEQIQELLLHVSLLDRIDLDACAALYPGTNCARTLPSLVRRNVFLTIATDGEGEDYRLHPLFQSFLRRRLRSEVGRSGVTAEHQRCAGYFLQKQSWEQAARHLVAAENFEGAAGLIAERGPDWIASGALASLATFADALPTAVLEANPRALAQRAEVARLCGDFEKAQSIFRRVISRCKQSGDAETEAESLHSLATIARREGDFELAFKNLDRALELSEPHSAVRMKCGNTRGLCLVALGEWAAAEREFRSSLQAADELNDERYSRLISHNLGTPAGIRGDFGEALRWFGRMLRSEQPDKPIPQEAVAHLNSARCHIYRGDFAAAEKHLDSALDRCQLFNLANLQAESFETYGNLYREQGEIDRAHEYYERAARAYNDAGIELDKTELFEERALLSLKARDFASAKTLIDRLLSARSPETDSRGFHTASLTHARIEVAQGEVQKATGRLESVSEYFRSHSLYYYEAQACMALAVCNFRLQREREMLDSLRRAIELAIRYDYEFWLQREVIANAELFTDADAAELLPADLRAAIKPEKLSAQARQPAIEIEFARPKQAVTDLTIYMLGPVEIVRDPTRPLAADAWTTRRARDILCFIASRRHRRASKDSIIDTFWGETDFEVVEKNFHPTVSHIRKALNSNQPFKQNFLVYRDGDYQLNSEFSYRIDIEEFDALLAAGENARRAHQFEACIQAYESAVELYRGEFMHGIYDPWVEEQRTYYREQYLRLLESLAGVAQKSEDWSQAMQLAKRILQEDQFREDIHCILMRGHAAMGNRGAVKEQYDALTVLLDRELGVEPSEDTTQLFHELFK